MKRDQHIRLRLVPASEGHAIEVVLSKDERAALDEAIQKMAYDGGLSTFIRDLGAHAAREHPAQTVLGMVTLASSAANMTLGEWFRTISLAAVGHTQIAAQIRNAREAYLRRFR